MVKLYSNERGLQQQVASLEAKVKSSYKQLEIVAGEKMTLDVRCWTMKAKVDDAM